MKLKLVLLSLLSFVCFAAFGEEGEEVKKSFMDYVALYAPVVALLLSELMAINPKWASNGILDFVLKLLGLFQKK